MGFYHSIAIYKIISSSRSDTILVSLIYSQTSFLHWHHVFHFNNILEGIPH